MQRADQTSPTPDDRRAPAERSTVYSTETLFNGAREIEIAHNGEIYRLRITRQGKLILNK
ncbi:hemin uptake protein HemP [Rhizobium sp. C1]|uniref:hemin uptake protein HemP n=1 Tax=Rhizobium sp. C1 TaxID=1349799 RepID=UPI001E37303A|nr:hemin uptake protein HemP [Rhizobium sp. C1]MCD2178419.1 hemin uptake protein HemP [Rhizobium sp. C1]